MKKSVVSIAVTISLLIGFSVPVRAMNEEWAAVAGFVGGLLFARASDYDPPAVITKTRVVQRSYAGGYHEVADGPACRSDAGHHRGHWKLVAKRIWVPGCWTWQHDACGRSLKVWVPGRYKIVQERVWVSAWDY